MAAADTQTRRATEREVRVDLAAAHRLAALDDLSEGTWNHFSHRVPERPDRMLMTPPHIHWSQMRASDLIELGGDEDVARELPPPSRAGHSIHYGLYAARADITCILHLHPPYATALASVVDGRLEPASQQAISLQSRIAYADEWPDQGGGGGELRGTGLADALGEADILILNHHGVLLVAPTVAIAYINLYQLERACRLQVLAMSTGRPLAVVHDRYLVARKRSDAWKNDSFAGLRAMLDTTSPGYGE
jgi:ribulose-5-phosphate 4-epimerase/fuculose-1-phosphate aldolase